ncbi:homeobox domain-containing protein [Pisolithus orientalis]|nr:homeobox domain-containing protein [Pisolithus orientalis]KAI6032865.1 homeobox domain-containing protein [Pisolithus orientalis]
MDASSSSSSRTFFPYIPNEVKHRKRTSRSQLKVLEEVYRKDTKPNAAIRKKLAAELDMLPRAVQVWFQNRRAKDKQLRKRAAAQHLQSDEQNTTTSQEEPQRDPSSDLREKLSEQTQERVSPHPSSTDSPPFAPDPSISPVGLHQSQSPPATPVDAWQHPLDPDIYNARRGSLPAVMPVQDSSLLPPPHFNVDRRKSLDVNCYRLVQHPYAGVVREKNEALLAKSPLSPPGSTQALTRPPSTMGPIRSASLLSPYAHPPRSSYENRPFAFASRAAPPPIPGPLPRPDFQFGESSSTPPSQNASPEGDTPPGSSSGSSAQASSPDISISMLHRWSFPRGSTTSITSATSPNGIPPHCSLREGDGDAEDAISTTPSSSIGCLSRFGSVASITGSESSVMFSDVSSCVAVDMGGDSSVRRGSW